MAAAVFIACALTSVICAVLLIRGYLASRSRLLLWSSLGFMGLALNNVILVVDRLVFAQDLSLLRSLPALLGVAVLLFGCIWDAD
ncbi:MAG: hypothetical protein H0T76_12270 [Nannocystis sp.]|nr:DUF5985 family protein [Nannocystis sp.]MBA3547252.1 hypothetical protein [Nannocystis sp.]